MRLLEYQGKELFAKYGIPVPRARRASTREEAGAAARDLGLPAVVKAQVLAGGRGKAGGVSVARTPEEAASEAGRILDLVIGGEPVRSLLVEEAVPHSEEMYLSVTLDRGEREFVALASRTGGVDVGSGERGMTRTPVPLGGLAQGAARSVASGLGLEGDASSRFADVLSKLERLSREEECELAEVNPLGLLPDGSLVALDSKVVLDDNALFRHPEFSRLPPEDPLEAEAARHGFAFVPLDGDVAVIGNGAGLVLSTLDLLADAGGSPACFLDLGGGAQTERVEAALRLVKRLPRVRCVVVNIFGGITRTTDVAEGLKSVLAEGPMPRVFARITGAEQAEAVGALEGTGVSLFPSAERAVRAAGAGAG